MHRKAFNFGHLIFNFSNKGSKEMTRLQKSFLQLCKDIYMEKSKYLKRIENAQKYKKNPKHIFFMVTFKEHYLKLKIYHEFYFAFIFTFACSKFIIVKLYQKNCFYRFYKV